MRRQRSAAADGGRGRARRRSTDAGVIVISHTCRPTLQIGPFLLARVIYACVVVAAVVLYDGGDDPSGAGPLGIDAI